MQLLSSILPIVALASTAIAAPVHNTTQEFNLKTVVVSGQTGKSQFNNLWMYSYHTGAGLSDATFSSDRSIASKAWFNITSPPPHAQYLGTINFDFGTDFPWGLSRSDDPYSAFSSVQINVGSGETGYLIPPANGVVASDSTEGKFGGWLVCNWQHTVPQLFWYIKDYPNFKVPANCAIVQLKPVYI